MSDFLILEYDINLFSFTAEIFTADFAYHPHRSLMAYVILRKFEFIPMFVILFYFYKDILKAIMS